MISVALSLLFTSGVFFSSPISSAADKEVDEYYSRKRHLPDLAARGTLPLHVLKMTQDQVSERVKAAKTRLSFLLSIVRVFVFIRVHTAGKSGQNSAFLCSNNPTFLNPTHDTFTCGPNWETTLMFFKVTAV